MGYSYTREAAAAAWNTRVQPEAKDAWRDTLQHALDAIEQELPAIATKQIGGAWAVAQENGYAVPDGALGAMVFAVRQSGHIILDRIRSAFPDAAPANDNEGEKA